MKESFPFRKTQTRLLLEMKAKHEQAWSQDLQALLMQIYDELGIGEMFVDGKHRFTLHPGFAGVDVASTEPMPEIPKG